MNEERKIQYLLDLIDDDNEQSASLAMAELLKTPRPDLVKSRLSDLQETPNLQLRRRIHQLQTAISMRGIREIFGQQLRSNTSPLLEGAIQLHLLWFDSDLPDAILGQWLELCNTLTSEEFYPSNLTDVGKFMMDQGFRPVLIKEALNPEQYCIGCALEHIPACDLLLSVITKCVTMQTGAGLQIIRSGMNFGVSDIYGELLFPGEDWRLVTMKEKMDSGMPWEYISDSVVLKTLATFLFQCAAASDGFRYMYTLGTVLALAAGKEKLDFLPYPYGSKK